MLIRLILALVVCVSLASAPLNSFAAPAKPPAGQKKVSVSQIHVIQGCSACETMMEWLRKGGVKLDFVRVQQGAYPLYPTVVYSDRTSDHGDRMYSQQVQIPKTICVVTCEFGTN